MISKRALSVDSSGIRRVFDLGAQLKSPINLSIGQPDFDALPEMKEAAKAAIDRGTSGYTVTQGIEPLRAKVREKYGIAESERADIDAFITSGVSGGLLLSYMALLDPGDEILIPDPFFCMYRDLALLVNAEPVYYDCYPDFKLPLEQIENSISSKTKAILLMSPGNPTGYAMTQDELDAVIEIARRKNIWVLYDEIYEVFCYDHAHAQCFRKYDKTIILNGMSKSHGIPGWRMGYAVGPADVVSEMLKIQQYSFVCTPSVVQWASLAGMDCDVSDIVAAYTEKRDFIYNGLKDKYNVVKPTGAFYIFPEAPDRQGQEFVEKCIKNNLLCVPGNVFSRADSHFRLSFASPMEMIEQGVELLNKLV